MSHTLIFKNTVYQTAIRIVTSGIGFVITILIARSFGILGYGNYTKVISFVTLFYLFLDFGLSAIYIQKDEKEVYFRDFVSLRLLLSLFLILLTNVISFFLPFQEVKTGIFIFSLTLVTQSVILCATALFQKKLAYEKLLKASATGSFITLLSICATIFFHSSLNVVFLSYVLGGIATVVLSLIFEKKHILPFSLNRKFTGDLIFSSLPLGLMLIFNLLYFRVDIILLSILKPTQDVGIYGFSYKFFDFLIALPLFLSNALYPILLKYQKNYRIFQSFVLKYTFVFLGSSLVLTLFCWFLSPLLSFIKPEFSRSIFPFRLLLFSLPFFFLTSLFQWVLIIYRKQKVLAVIYFFSALLNILLNLIFIPLYSYVASAIITGVSEAVVLIVLIALFASLHRNNMRRQHQII